MAVRLWLFKSVSNDRESVPVAAATPQQNYDNYDADKEDQWETEVIDDLSELCYGSMHTTA